MTYCASRETRHTCCADGYSDSYLRGQETFYSPATNILQDVQLCGAGATNTDVSGHSCDSRGSLLRSKGLLVDLEQRTRDLGEVN